MLPKDLWSPKGIVAGGMDTFIYKKDIAHYWGTEPLDFYVTTESLFIAVQGWNKKAMTFIPDSVFFEFLPLSQAHNEKEPRSSLKTLDQIEEGGLYEVIVTQFHGMPLIRYRMGDVVKVLSLEDTETGVRLPQIAIQRKVGETIDLAGLSTLDEKTIWQALADTGVKYSDWTARKEYAEGKSYLNIYLEPLDEIEPRQLEPLVHKNLETIDEDYRDVEKYLDIQPIRITALSPGTFKQYLEEKVREGADLAHLKPRHINPKEKELRQLLILSKVCSEEYAVSKP